MHSRFPTPTRRFRPTLGIVIFVILAFVLILVVSGFFGDSNSKKEDEVTSEGIDHGHHDDVEHEHHHDDHLEGNHNQEEHHEDGHHHENEKPLLTEHVDDFEESPEARMKRRREVVKEMFRYAYGGYENKCFPGAEELKPISGTCHNWLIRSNPLTTIDCLDTIILMNETGYFERARRHIEGINWDQPQSVCFFETTILMLEAFYLLMN